MSTQYQNKTNFKKNFICTSCITAKLSWPGIFAKHAVCCPSLY